MKTSLLAADVLICGDSWGWTTEVDGYPSSSYTLKYQLIPQVAGPTPFTITAGVGEGDGYRVGVSPTTTAGYTAGAYSWQAWVEKSGFRMVVDSGIVSLKPDPATATAMDSRSPARAALDAANAALAAFGSNAYAQVLEYTLNGRMVRYRAFADQSDFLTFRSKLRAEVWREEAAEKMAAGLPNPRHLNVRLARA